MWGKSGESPALSRNGKPVLALDRRFGLMVQSKIQNLKSKIDKSEYPLLPCFVVTYED
jgi:hypothetical protein